jgi:hypothetical protein
MNVHLDLLPGFVAGVAIDVSTQRMCAHRGAESEPCGKPCTDLAMLQQR